MYGKIIGSLIGLAILKLPGLFLGLLIGYLFDKIYAKEFIDRGGFARFFSAQGDVKQQAIFFHALFSSLGHISKADGQVTPEEIDIASQLMENMQLTAEAKKEAQQAFREGKSSDFPLETMLNEFKIHCHSKRDVLQVFLEILISAACADGEVTRAELIVLEKVAKTLGFHPKDLHFLISTYEAEQRFRSRFNQNKGDARSRKRQQQYQQYSNENSISDAYKILGVSESDDDKLVKRAYKRQMSLHHPDKLAAKGLPQQALELAKNKTQDIQAAYELIKEKRGM